METFNGFSFPPVKMIDPNADDRFTQIQTQSQVLANIIKEQSDKISELEKALKNRQTATVSVQQAGNEEDYRIDDSVASNDEVVIFDVDDRTLIPSGKVIGHNSGDIPYNDSATENTDLWAARATSADNCVPAGVIADWGGIDAPSGWLLCYGQAVSRTTYAALFAALTKSKGTFTVTIASPAVVTLNNHGLITGDCVALSTTGAMPTGLSANTNYFVIYVNSNTFRLATSLANAKAGTAINTSGTQNGTHSLLYCPHGVSGATNFLIPDGRGVATRGYDGMGGTARQLDDYTSATNRRNLGSYQSDDYASHTHAAPVGLFVIRSDAGGVYVTASGYAKVHYADPGTKSTGSSGGNETRMKNIALNKIIKY